MKIFYSTGRKGFFDAELFDSTTMPADAVEITQAAYKALFAGQTAGKEIMWDRDDGPYLADRFVPDDSLAAASRAERNDLLAASDWTQLPDVPDSVKNVWAAYRQALRDVPQQAGFPRSIQWPTKP